MGRAIKEGENPVGEKLRHQTVSRVPPDTWNPVGTWGDHPPSLNTTWWPIAHSTVKEKHPGRGVKENLKPCVYKHRKFINERSGTFCRMVRRVNVTGKVKHLRCEAVARASLKRAHEVSCIRPETGWPTHVQAEVQVKLHGGPNRLPLKW